MLNGSKKSEQLPLAVKHIHFSCDSSAFVHCSTVRASQELALFKRSSYQEHGFCLRLCTAAQSGVGASGDPQKLIRETVTSLS